MTKPRIFLGSSGKQAKLLKAITRGLEDVADVEPSTTTFNPGRSTLDRLVELSQEVDFAAFVFAQDDWTQTDASRPPRRRRATTWCSRPACSAARSGCGARSSSTPNQGRAYEEIAEILSLPLGTVKTYIHRARNELRLLLAHLKE